MNSQRKKPNELPVCPNCGPRAVMVSGGQYTCCRCKRRLGPARRLFAVDGYGWTC